MNIITGLSSWMLALVALTGLAYAALLYYRNKTLPFSKQLQVLLFILRFLVVSLIALLLLNPYLMQNKKVVEQPILILAQDNSSSLILNTDSLFYKYKYPLRFDSLTAKLGKDFDIDQYTFGQIITQAKKLDFTEQRTDFSALLKELSVAYYRRNVGAVVLLSDGIYNAGIQPELLAGSFPFPVYSVGLGDTITYPDLSISDLRYNRLIYNKSDFPVEVTIRAKEAMGTKAILQIYMDGKKVGEQSISIGSNRFSVSHSFLISATENGTKKMVIEVQGLENETILLNNRREFYIEIINQKQQVLMLARSPHPDLAAMRAVFGDYFEISTAFIQTWKPDEKSYSLIILHQLPGEGINNNLLESYLETNKDTPVLYIVGGQTDLSALNRLQNSIQILNVGQSSMIDAMPVPDPSFTLFSFETFQRDRIRKFPALSSPLVEYSVPVSFSSFLFQKIKGIETNYPLIGFSEGGERPVGFINGTGIWRWRLSDFNQNGNHETFNEMVGKIVNYLLVKQDRRRLRIFTEAEFLVNDEILFKAELYNPSLELIDDVDVKLVLNHVESKTSNEYIFSRDDNKSYQLNVGRLPSGLYNFYAEAVSGNELLRYEGAIVVLASSFEGQSLIADHHLLYRISRLTGGTFVPLGEMMSVPDLIAADQRITSVASFTKEYELLTNLHWFLALLILLLSAEWFLRKTFGSY